MTFQIKRAKYLIFPFRHATNMITLNRGEVETCTIKHGRIANVNREQSEF